MHIWRLQPNHKSLKYETMRERGPCLVVMYAATNDPIKAASLFPIKGRMIDLSVRTDLSAPRLYVHI